MFDTLTLHLIELMNKSIFGEIPPSTPVEIVDNKEGQDAADGITVDTVEEAEVIEIPSAVPATPDMFPREVVTKLRQENAEWRKKLRANETEVKKLSSQLADMQNSQEKVKKDEELAKLETTERLNMMIKELEAKNTELRQQIEGLEVERGFVIKTKRIEEEARSLGFHDPTDAINLMDQKKLTELEVEAFDVEMVKDELQAILDRKPYLAIKKIEGTPPAELPTNSASQVKINAKKPGELKKNPIDEARKQLGPLVRTGQGGQALKIFLKDIWGQTEQGTPYNPRKVS